MSRGKATDRIANYSTTIEVEQTVAEIHRRLSVARSITSVTYDYARPDGHPRRLVGLLFTTDTVRGPRSFYLHPEIYRVRETLVEQWEDGLIARKYTDADQVERVAWRLLHDWIKLVLDYVRIGVLTFEDAMMGKMVVEDGKTVSDVYTDTTRSLAASRVVEGLVTSR